MGSVPPDATVVMRVSDAPSTANDVIELLAAFTPNRKRASLLSTTEPCEPSPAPVPLPSVANDPADESEPSAAREKASTALPPAALLSVNTAPTSVSAPPREKDGPDGIDGDVASRAQPA